MPFDVRVPLLTILAAGGILYAIFLMPPLTNGDTRMSSASMSEAEVGAMRATEAAYCRSQPEALDCQCFVDRSGTVLSHNEPRVPGVVYADKQDLARGQARRSC